MDTGRALDIFHEYMRDNSIKVSRAEFEKNLFLKQKSLVFINDAEPLLSPEQAKHYRPEMAYEMMFRDFLAKLEGEPWKGLCK